MKRVVSISIGSSSRNHKVDVEILGERFLIERIGTDGDLRRAAQMVAELDGKVDVFGLGGMDLYVYLNKKRYTFRDAYRIAQQAKRTPVVDGSGLKNSLERWVVQYLDSQTEIKLRGKKVLLVMSVDRFGMADAMSEFGCRLTLGDVAFGLGIPLPLHSLRQLCVFAVIMPIIVRLPITWLYPVGEKQKAIVPRFQSFYAEADVIAGDFHYIRRHMPADLRGKTILTNTVTPADIVELRDRGVHCLITTTPDLGGRSFGTNVLEAVLVAVSGKRAEELTADDYMELIERIGFKPRIEYLN
jgi:hypothetical protein